MHCSPLPQVALGVFATIPTIHCLHSHDPLLFQMIFITRMIRTPTVLHPVIMSDYYKGLKHGCCRQEKAAREGWGLLVGQNVAKQPRSLVFLPNKAYYFSTQPSFKSDQIRHVIHIYNIQCIKLFFADCEVFAMHKMTTPDMLEETGKHCSGAWEHHPK